MIIRGRRLPPSFKAKGDRMARVQQLYEQIQQGSEVRQNLIVLKKNLTDEGVLRSFMYFLEGDFSVFEKLLGDEDPKVRKNAALILGMTEDEDVLPALFEAWKEEETLFVRPDYLRAMEKLDYGVYRDQLSERVRELEETCGEDVQQQEDTPLWDNNKHLYEELVILKAMLGRFEKKNRHVFARYNPAPDLILTVNRLHTGLTASKISSGEVHEMKNGVHVKGGDLKQLTEIRTWIECLFTIPGSRPIEGDEKEIAQKLHELKIGNFLNYLHTSPDAPAPKIRDVFRYRIELRSASVDRDKRGEFIRRLARRLDTLERGLIQNTESDYEAEIRLIERKDKTFVPMLKLFTLPDTRFSYRRETTAQSMSPANAATAAELARPYLKENAQVLDPFCGTGTLLIERMNVLHADPVYAVDKFAEAVEKARINTERAGKIVHYINRDFFDFTHDYLFDEIFTEVPHTDAEAGPAFARRFFEKAATLLKEEARVTVVTDDPGSYASAAGGTAGFRKLAEIELNERLKNFVMIFEFSR